jgi:heat shock protein HslJ
MARRGLIEPVPGAMVSLSFDAASTLSGRSGCRALTGGYAVDGERLVIAPVDVAGTACEGALRRQEQRLRRLLERAASWERDGDVLRLRDGDGDVLIQAEAIGTAALESSALSSPSPSAAPA